MAYGTASLGTKYTCPSFVTDLTNAWDNYYDLKEKKYAPIYNRYTGTPTTGYSTPAYATPV